MSKEKAGLDYDVEFIANSRSFRKLSTQSAFLCTWKLGPGVDKGARERAGEVRSPGACLCAHTCAHTHLLAHKSTSLPFVSLYLSFFPVLFPHLSPTSPFPLLFSLLPFIIFHLKLYLSGSLLVSLSFAPLFFLFFLLSSLLPLWGTSPCPLKVQTDTFIPDFYCICFMFRYI